MSSGAGNLAWVSISVVIPSYNRGQILLKTLQQLFAQSHPADEIIVVDQTCYQSSDLVLKELQELATKQKIRFLQREIPSIPAAMNAGLKQALSDYVLFLDDDVEFDADFIQSHRQALLKRQADGKRLPIAQVGQILQPGQKPAKIDPSYQSSSGLERDLAFPFCSTDEREIYNCMAGNLCVNRNLAIAAGGFDENFYGAAYRFETEFCRRFCRSAGEPFVFVPQAGLRHLQWQTGGTRAHANHLTSMDAVHSAGDYYFACKESIGSEKLAYILRRLRRSLVARFYLRRPWYIPLRVLGEFRGILKGYSLSRKTPKLIDRNRVDRKPRLAIYMSHATQHFAPLYKEIASLGELSLRVYYACDNGVGAYTDAEFAQTIQWDVPLLEGYDYEFLDPGKALKKFTFASMDSKNVRRSLTDFMPDVIWVHGYGQLGNWRILLNRPLGTKVLYSSDSNLLTSRSGVKRLLKMFIVRLFFSRCDAFISISSANQRYLKHYGVPDSKIINSSFPIDISRWENARASLTQSSLNKIRQELSIPVDSLVMLFAGKLVAHKRAIDVIEAFAMLDGRAGEMKVSLIIIGSGSELARLRERCKQLDIGDRVSLIGFKNQTELAAYFELADLFIFPSSREPYGAVAAEILPFGLPIIAARDIGAVGSAIVDQRNALLYNSGDVLALKDCMTKLIDDPELRSSMASESKKVAVLQDKSVMAKDIAAYCKDKNASI